MQRPQLLIGILLSAGLLIGLLVWWTGQQPKRFSWRTTYQLESKEPYGTFVIHQLLRQYFPGHTLTDIRDSIAQLPLSQQRANYIFVGQGISLSPAESDHLLAFVEAGNTALLALQVMPEDFLTRLSSFSCSGGSWSPETHWDTLSRVNFKHPDLRFEKALPMVFHTAGNSATHPWGYFPDRYFCDAEPNISPLGTMLGKGVNLLRLPHGQGFFYLHTQPILLTNYFVLQESGRRYAEALLSHLEEGPIYWDEYSRISDRMAQQNNNPGDKHPRLESDSALSYVLSQPPLAWAWYLLLGLGLLFLLFGAKRRQAVVPVWEPNTNTSLEFIHTIGWLYFHRSSHFQLAGLAIKLFHTHVLERYGIALQSDAADYSRQVATRAGVEESLVNDILQLYATFERNQKTDELQLTIFNRRLEAFYRLSK